MEVCEQLFSWLSKFAPITKHMNRWRFMLYLVDNHITMLNGEEVGALKR